MHWGIKISFCFCKYAHTVYAHITVWPPPHSQLFFALSHVRNGSTASLYVQSERLSLCPLLILNIFFASRTLARSLRLLPAVSVLNFSACPRLDSGVIFIILIALDVGRKTLVVLNRMITS